MGKIRVLNTRIFPIRKIRYNSLKNSLSDVIARLQGLLFSTTSGHYTKLAAWPTS